MSLILISILSDCFMIYICYFWWDGYVDCRLALTEESVDWEHLLRKEKMMVEAMLRRAAA